MDTSRVDGVKAPQHFKTRRSHLEGPVLHVGLDRGIGELPADEAFRVEDRVEGVHGHLVLRRVADEALRLVERDVRRRRAVALVVRDDLYSVILPDADAGVGRA